MRRITLGLAVPMLACTVAPVAAGPAIPLPVEVVSSERLGIGWVKVREGNDETLVNGFVFRKRSRFFISGHLDVNLVRQGQVVACHAVRWAPLPRRRGGSASFHAALKAPAMAGDAITIRHATDGRRCAEATGGLVHALDAAPPGGEGRQ